MKNNYLIIGLIVVLVGAGAFWGGMKYAQSSSPQGGRGNFAGRNFNGQFGQGGPGGMMGLNGQNRGNSLTAGEILSKDDKSITLKLRNGGSMVVFFSGSTNISKSVETSPTDLEIGKTVVVGGSANQDGSITAQTIQLRDIPNPPAANGNQGQPAVSQPAPIAPVSGTQPSNSTATNK